MVSIKEGSVKLKKGDLVCASALTVYDEMRQPLQGAINTEQFGIVTGFKNIDSWRGHFEYVTVYWQDEPTKTRKLRIFKLYKVTIEDGIMMLQQGLDKSEHNKSHRRAQQHALDERTKK